jgi:hypothetical protein
MRQCDWVWLWQVQSQAVVALSVDMAGEGDRGVKLALLDQLEAAVDAQRHKDLLFVQVPQTRHAACVGRDSVGSQPSLWPCVQEAIRAVLRWSNAVPGVEASNLAGRQLNFWLARYAGEEGRVAVEYLVGLLMSTQATQDLAKVSFSQRLMPSRSVGAHVGKRVGKIYLDEDPDEGNDSPCLQVNMFLPPALASELLALTALTTCHATRLGQLNRVLSDVSSLRGLVKR